MLESALEVVLQAHRSPDRLDLQVTVDTWRDVREAFPPGVKAWEWALVDGALATCTGPPPPF